MPDTVEAQNAVGVSGLSSEGGFEVEAADGEAVDASGNVDGLFPFVLRFAEWAPTKTSAYFEVEADKVCNRGQLTEVSLGSERGRYGKVFPIGHPSNY